MKPNIVYKIVTKTNWNGFIKSQLKECKGFDNDIRDGFIHLSTHDQLYSTFTKKYNIDEVNKFCLIAVDLSESKDVRWETAKNEKVYPHLYSPLILGKNISWVIALEKYQFDADGL